MAGMKEIAALLEEGKTMMEIAQELDLPLWAVKEVVEGEVE